MKTESENRKSSVASLFIVGFYCLINTVFMCEYFVAKGTLSVFANIVFTIDLFTWHIYGLFAIISFIVKVFKKNQYSKLNIFLHLIFMMISLFEICYMIQIAF